MFNFFDHSLVGSENKQTSGELTSKLETFMGMTVPPASGDLPQFPVLYSLLALIVIFYNDSLINRVIVLGEDTLVTDRCIEFKRFIDGQTHWFVLTPITDGQMQYLSRLEVLVPVFRRMILQSAHLERAKIPRCFAPPFPLLLLFGG
jgi:hypothetical protein